MSSENSPHLSSQTREKLYRLRKKNNLTVRIKSYSDKDKDPKRQLMWGDYWVKHELADELGNLGLLIVEKEPDVLIHLFGSPTEGLSKDTYNIVWFYSHPDRVNSENLKEYDRIYCASSDFIPKLRKMGYENAELMFACTSKQPPDVPIEYDIVFVGNARTRRADGRSVISDMGKTEFNFKVWGNLWENILPNKYYGGRYWAYQELQRLYASSLITLNDHHHDMAREGFVSNKIFDILAGGGFAISQNNSGIEGIFEDSVPQYESAEQLRDLVKFYLRNPKERERLMLKGRRIALDHTYQKRAIQMTRDFLSD
ncbi:glycosyltransferase [Thermodesulfobacteriota bacterium]